jgi:very-short-patch-repair endonuclease
MFPAFGKGGAGGILETNALPSLPPLEKGGERGFLEQMLSYEKQLKTLSRYLRNNMTEAEKMLWQKLGRKQLKGHPFYRQKIIGTYIVDFYCPKVNLVIEADGGQHYTDIGKTMDSIREETLTKMGIRIVRFSDRDVFENMSGVIEEIWHLL